MLIFALLYARLLSSFYSCFSLLFSVFTQLCSIFLHCFPFLHFTSLFHSAVSLFWNIFHFPFPFDSCTFLCFHPSFLLPHLSHSVQQKVHQSSPFHKRRLRVHLMSQSRVLKVLKTVCSCIRGEVLCNTPLLINSLETEALLFKGLILQALQS